MTNVLRWVVDYIHRDRRNPTTEVLCVHGKTGFQRNEIAAQLFKSRLANYKSGAIVCRACHIVPVLSSLGVATPDGMKFWSTIRKIEFADAHLDPRIKILLCAQQVRSKLVWIDGGAMANGYAQPTGTLIFTGSINDDPFVELERTTFIPGPDGGKSFQTRAGEYCSSWHC